MRASRIAGLLGLVDPEDFTDKRNKPLRIYTTPRQEKAPAAALPADDAPWQLPRLDGGAAEPPLLEIPGLEVSGYGYDIADEAEAQALITEKMDDLLEPACAELEVDLLPGKGYESHVRAIQLLRHVQARPGQRLFCWYISDYDDAGDNMPVQVVRCCQYFAEQLGIDADIIVQPLALTREQVERYDLPQAPDKRQVELDALEGIYPGELERIFRTGHHEGPR